MSTIKRVTTIAVLTALAVVGTAAAASAKGNAWDLKPASTTQAALGNGWDSLAV